MFGFVDVGAKSAKLILSALISSALLTVKVGRDRKFGETAQAVLEYSLSPSQVPRWTFEHILHTPRPTSRRFLGVQIPECLVIYQIHTCAAQPSTTWLTFPRHHQQSSAGQTLTALKGERRPMATQRAVSRHLGEELQTIPTNST